MRTLDLTPLQRLAALKESGVTLFPNLSREEKAPMMYLEEKPASTTYLLDMFWLDFSHLEITCRYQALRGFMKTLRIDRE